MQSYLSDDQALFLETTLRFIETELPIERTRLLHDDAVGYDRSWLQKSAELGWFAMLVSEADGGGSVSGVGLLDAAIVAESLGRYVQPGPFVPMNVVADALGRDGSAAQRAELLPGIVGGELVVTWAFAEGAVTIERRGDELALSGERQCVQDAASADVLLVVGELDGAPAQVLVRRDAKGLALRPLQSLDLSRRFADVSLDNVVVRGDALLASADASAAIERQRQVAVVLNCAEMIGAMDALFSMTVAYAKDRIAFGRPIGSFQSLKHVMADQALHLETAKAVAAAAARAVAEGNPSAAEVASMAAACVGDFGHELAQECLQIHGGIGYTWEHDLHLLMRRIQSNAVLYGEPSWHRERVCVLHHLGEGR